MLRNTFDKIFKSGIFATESQQNMSQIILPDDIWIEILQRVEDKTLFRCRLVCRTWNDILNGSSFWLRKCQKIKVVLPPLNIPSSRDFNYRKFYFKKPFNRNFIKNPNGEEGVKHWNIINQGGQGFRIEKPPNGSDTEGFPVCFATSYGACVKEQIIDLHKEGCDAWILNELQPKIEVSEWHAARFDCASTYKLYVALLKDTPKPSTNDGHDWNFGQADDAPYCRQDAENVVAEFFEPTIVEQWVGRAWQETFHTFEDYGHGVRYILFQSYGKDRQFWAGYYGPKMSKASLRLTFE